MWYWPIGILMLSIASLDGQAASKCNTTLTKEDRYEDLNRTLQCLSSKIQDLERRMASEGGRPAMPGSANKKSVPDSPLAADHVYRDDNFEVTLKSCTKKGKSIHCVVVYKNISEMNVEVGIDYGTTYLVDENGERWDYKSNTAIRKGSNGTEIIQHTHLITKFVFIAQEDTTGAKFSIYINHYLPPGKFKITFNDIFLN